MLSGQQRAKAMGTAAMNDRAGGSRPELLKAHEDLMEIVRRQAGIIDRLFLALSQVADIGDEDLEAICAAAKLQHDAEEKGFL